MSGLRIVSKEEASQTPYPYVMVTDQGDFRELTPDEKAHLEEEYVFGDGARPYVKFRYLSRDGWGRIEGYLRRKSLPYRFWEKAGLKNPWWRFWGANRSESRDTEGNGGLRIQRCVRIDYPQFEDRIDSEPVGIFLEFAGSAITRGLRISESATGVDFSFEPHERFQQYVEGVYGIEIEASADSALGNLVNKKIINIYFGLIDPTPITNFGFTATFGNRVAVQIEFDTGPVLTFWNSGDQSEYSFGYPIKPVPFEAPFEDLVWRQVPEFT